jgi:hypothetical protein
MDQTGHSTLDFDLKMTPSVKVLMEKFDTLIGWGYRAVGMDRIFWLGIYRRLQATEGSSRFQYVCPDEFRIGSNRAVFFGGTVASPGHHDI